MNRVTIIEAGGERIIDALIQNISWNQERNSKQYNRKQTFCVFMKGLNREIRKSKRDFISHMKQKFHGIKYIHLENKFGKIYFFTKNQCDEALKIREIEFKNVIITLHEFRQQSKFPKSLSTVQSGSTIMVSNASASSNLNENWTEIMNNSLHRNEENEKSAIRSRIVIAQSSSRNGNLTVQTGNNKLQATETENNNVH